ncbi:hypothetical protein ILUMI_02203, partial [Ignelater luminosus]
MEIALAVMSYKRFLFLLRCLRFDHKFTRIERRKQDKLAAIRSIFDSFVKNCKSSYSLGEFVTIDEKMQAFRGHCSFVQYIPNKPAKYGIKMFALCDGKTFYTDNLEIYCGKQPEGPYMQSNSPTDIVNRLVRHIEGSCRNLITDNWYTSYSLAMSLLERKLTFFGTMSQNKREIPPDFLPDKKRKTVHDSGQIDEETHKPEIILNYNAAKGAVDTVDQMCGTYSVARVTRRWPLVVFYALLDIAGINTHVMFYSNEGNPKDFRRIFLKTLVFGLTKPHLEEPSNILTLPKDINVFLSKYRPEETTSEEEHLRKKRERCHAKPVALYVDNMNDCSSQLDSCGLPVWMVGLPTRNGRCRPSIIEVELTQRETQWPSSGQTIIDDDHSVYYVGEDSVNHRNGVAIILSKEATRTVTGVIQHSDRIIVEEFYRDLERVCNLTIRHEVAILMGDMDTKIGNGREDSIIEDFGLENRNDRGDSSQGFVRKQN